MQKINQHLGINFGGIWRFKLGFYLFGGVYAEEIWVIF